MLRSLCQHSFSRILNLGTRNMSDVASKYKFETLKVTSLAENVLQVEMNRPDKRNAMNRIFWKEVTECFEEIDQDGDCRAVVLSGAGKAFTAGLDLKDFMNLFSGQTDLEVSRKAFFLHKFLLTMQGSFTSIEKCKKPVIAAVHGACVGGGVDMICACDIRYSSQDAFFQIKEVDLGLAADIGTLQRLPKIVGNDSVVRELAYTARRFEADEAKDIGLISRVFPNKESLVNGAVQLATKISSKSPVAVQGSKVNLVYSRDHSVPESLEYIASWNAAMLQSEDMIKAAMASMQKEEPVFDPMSKPDSKL